MCIYHTYMHVSLYDRYACAELARFVIDTLPSPRPPDDLARQSAFVVAEALTRHHAYPNPSILLARKSLYDTPRWRGGPNTDVRHTAAGLANMRHRRSSPEPASHLAGGGGSWPSMKRSKLAVRPADIFWAVPAAACLRLSRNHVKRCRSNNLVPSSRGNLGVRGCTSLAMGWKSVQAGMCHDWHL